MKKLIIIILTAFTSLASYSQQKTQFIGLPDNTVEVRNKLRIDALKDATGDSVMVVDAGGNVKLKAITDFTGIGGGGTSGPDSLYLENPIYSVKEVNENGDTIQVIKFRADSLPELRYASAMRDTNNWIGSTLVDVDYLNDRISGLGAGGSNNPDSTTASNGLTLVGKDVQLGGHLTSNVNIYPSPYKLSIHGAYFLGDGIEDWGYAHSFVDGTYGNDIKIEAGSGDGGYSNSGYSGIHSYSIAASGPGTGDQGINIYAYNSTVSKKSIIDLYKGTYTITSDGDSLIKFRTNQPVRLYQYGTGVFTGTLAKSLGVDASGNVIEYDAGSGGGGTYTASNGLTMVGSDVQLGGTLTSNANISTGSYQLNLSGTSANGGNTILLVTDAGGGNGVTVNGTTGTAVLGTATSGVGGYFKSDGGQGLIGESYSSIGITGRSSLTYPISADKTVTNTNDLTGGLKVSQTVTSTAVAGFGTSIDYILTTAFPTSRISNQLISKWTDAADATRSSEFSIAGVYGGVTNTLFTLAGNGQLTLNKYGTGAFPGTPTYALKVDATGKVIEVPNSTNYTVVTMVDNAAIGLALNTFTVLDAAGTIPNYQLQFPEPAGNGDIIEIKFSAPVTSLTYGGTATVIGGRTSALQGEYMRFIYKASIHVWY